MLSARLETALQTNEMAGAVGDTHSFVRLLAVRSPAAFGLWFSLSPNLLSRMFAHPVRHMPGTGWLP